MTQNSSLHIAYKMVNPNVGNDLKVSRTSRFLAPADFIFEIKSLSVLLNSATEKFDSTTFESGGYKWKLSLYPRGNHENKTKGYISMYLSILETDKLSRNWEVNVCFKFFVLNQDKNEYLSVQVDGGKVWRFHNLRKEWGIDELLAIDIFDDPDNGYLVEDSCAFGVELYVIRSKSATIESVDISKTSRNSTYTWRIDDYASKVQGSKELKSPEFTIRGLKWKLELFPNGNGSGKGKFVSLFLSSVDVGDSYDNIELRTKYKLRILDRFGNVKEREGNAKFDSSKKEWGFQKFLSLEELNDPSKKYLINNTLVVEAETFG